MSSELRLGLAIEPSAVDITASIELARAAERLGFTSLWTGEAYGFDAITPLAWLAAHTTSIAVGTSIMQMPGRTPAMTAMTAVTMSELSGGRFRLGLGLSGPRVAEGWHGVPADAPLRRTREYLDLVRQALRADGPVALDGSCYQVPYRGPGATGLGATLRPMASTQHRVPVYLAAIGPKNVRLAIEETDGLLPILWSPRRWADAYGTDLFDDAADDFDVAPRVWVSIGDDLDACRDEVRAHIAFYIGAMGPQGKNFYAELIRRYGYEEVVEQVAQCYAERRGRDAAQSVPDALVDDLALVGPRSHVDAQLDAWRGGPARTVIIDGHDVRTLELLAELVL